MRGIVNTRYYVLYIYIYICIYDYIYKHVIFYICNWNELMYVYIFIYLSIMHIKIIINDTHICAMSMRT